MAIEKSNVKLSRFDSEYSHGSDESMSSYGGEDRLELRRKTSGVNVDSEDDDDSDDGDRFAEDDSGAGSDDFDLLELAESGAEFSQVGDVTCSVPFELYDLSSLEDILSVDVWNECLTEEERLSLSCHLPDLDQYTFMLTLKQLFEGCNFHFGSPVKKLFDMLKGGQCEPRNVLYLEGRNLFVRTKHYHTLRKYHNDMVVNLCQTRDAWATCRGYSVDEKLRVLNIVKSQKTLMREEKDYYEEDSSEKEEPFDGPWSRKVKDRKSAQNKMSRRSGYVVDSGLEFPRQWQPAVVEQDRYGRPKSKQKTATLKFPFDKTSVGPYAYNTSSLARQKYGSNLVLGSEDNMDDDDQDPLFGTGSWRDQDIVVRKKSGFLRLGKKHRFSREEELNSERFMGPPYSARQSHSNVAKSSKYANQMKPVKGSLADLRGDVYRHGKYHGDGFSVDPRYISDDLNGKSRKRKFERDSPDTSLRSYRTSMQQMNERFLNSDFRENQVQDGENLDARLVSCSSGSKRRKVRESLMDMERREDNGEMRLYSDIQQPVSDIIASKRKGKKKMEVDVDFLDLETSETPKVGKSASEPEVETKPQKKPYVLITPTVHTGFSFSIMHLLTAVRMAITSPCPQDPLDVSKAMAVETTEHEAGENGAPIPKDPEDNKSPQQESGNLPSLTIQEITSLVTSKPLDPLILQTQEPLQDLIRGVLKIFSSKTSPLGAKGWKPLVAFEKSKKCWSWIGPVLSPSEQETVEEVTSPEAWGLTHKMLVKLVDSFANWLKNSQETLQQIGSLPEPPLSLMQCNLDEKERFKDLRAQKSLTTIPQSSDEAREYFRKEEFLRYSISDRAFVYTAADGRKSIVAPLRRGGGKPTSKARDHFMLKRERPPHVTILCLVRDAAARLPGSIGTRADVCTLIRDSQYIMENVNEIQINQVVSGALDRLHYERDPCVQFDSDRKLWQYLHRDREEEDFEDDGTSSTKKWKRPKKEAAEQTEEQEAVTVAFNGDEKQTGNEMGSEKKTDEPSGVDWDQGAAERLCNGAEQAAEEEQDVENTAQGNETAMWEPVVSNRVEDNTFICQENSVADDFDDET
ncbi:DNA-binding protein-like [Hirschfeldia incana]|nr:DNA-binding protein-like [Hirschfeldia incana]